MASKNTEEVDVSVFANPLKASSVPKRIESIDLVKGFAMIFIIIAHSSGAWLDDDWIFLHGEVYAVLDVLGPSLFIFLSALSVVFSVQSKKGKLPNVVLRNKILLRGIVIIGIGFLYNVFIPGFTQGDDPLPFPWVLWSWSILVFIGFSQIFSYYALKIPKLPRLVVGCLIIFISFPIREWLVVDIETDSLKQILHFIIVSPSPQVSFLPWFGFCFISTLFGEMLYETMVDGSPQAYNDLVKKFLIIGVILVVFGISIGSELVHYTELSWSEYPSIKLLWFANKNPWFDFLGMPLFLIRGMPSNQFYLLGMALIIMAVAFYLVDIKKHNNHLTRILKFYGQVSLSIFLFHYIGILILIEYSFNIVVFPFICLSFIGFYGMLFYIWFKYADGVGSPEWIMLKMGQMGKKKKKPT